jgi:hypothetical protein
MLEEQLKKIQNNQDHQGIGEEALRKKLVQSESKIQSLENFRKQMQRLVDQQAIEIQTWKKRAQSISDELVSARKEYETHERSRSEQLQRLMNELIKQRRQIILAEERIAAASVIQKEIQQHFDQSQYLREGRGGAISSFVNGLEYIAEQVISKLFGTTKPNNNGNNHPQYGFAGSLVHSKDIPLETMARLGGELEQSAKAAEAALSRMDNNIEMFSHSRSSSKDTSETITV